MLVNIKISTSHAITDTQCYRKIIEEFRIATIIYLQEITVVIWMYTTIAELILQILDVLWFSIQLWCFTTFLYWIIKVIRYPAMFCRTRRVILHTTLHLQSLKICESRRGYCEPGRFMSADNLRDAQTQFIADFTTNTYRLIAPIALLYCQ